MTIRHWEAGRNRPSLQHLQDIADMYAGTVLQQLSQSIVVACT